VLHPSSSCFVEASGLHHPSVRLNLFVESINYLTFFFSHIKSANSISSQTNKCKLDTTEPCLISWDAPDSRTVHLGPRYALSCSDKTENENTTAPYTYILCGSRCQKDIGLCMPMLHWDLLYSYVQVCTVQQSYQNVSFLVPIRVPYAFILLNPCNGCHVRPANECSIRLHAWCMFCGP